MTCCIIPRKPTINSTLKECEKRCGSDDLRGCCGVDCINEVEKLYVNDSFNDDRFKEMFENSISESSKQEEWKPVIKAAYDSCHELSRTKSFLDVQILNFPFPVPFMKDVPNECKSPAFVHLIERCMLQECFLRCPATLFNPTEHCEAMKKFIASSEDMKHYSMRFGTRYVMFYGFFKNRTEKNNKYY